MRRDLAVELPLGAVGREDALAEELGETRAHVLALDVVGKVVAQHVPHRLWRREEDGAAAQQADHGQTHGERLAAAPLEALQDPVGEPPVLVRDLKESAKVRDAVAALRDALELVRPREEEREHHAQDRGEPGLNDAPDPSVAAPRLRARYLLTDKHEGRRLLEARTHGT